MLFNEDLVIFRSLRRDRGLGHWRERDLNFSKQVSNQILLLTSDNRFIHAAINVAHITNENFNLDVPRLNYSFRYEKPNRLAYCMTRE